MTRCFSGPIREYRQWRRYLRAKYGRARDYLSLETRLVHRVVYAVAVVAA